MLGERRKGSPVVGGPSNQRARAARGIADHSARPSARLSPSLQFGFATTCRGFVFLGHSSIRAAIRAAKPDKRLARLDKRQPSLVNTFWLAERKGVGCQH